MPPPTSTRWVHSPSSRYQPAISGPCSACRVDSGRPGPRLLLAGIFAEERYAAARAEEPGFRIDAQLVAGVGDVEVAHRELADAIRGTEERLAFLHREAFRLVGEVGA